jgi:O-antigen biosynthesis protein
VETFERTDHCAVGGPNIPPGDDGRVAASVARAPGGPIHVLLSDSEAEHIPGCNMAFRRDALEAIGGFDPQFHAAGDDVDVCWRLQERGSTIGFNAAAAVWHHRRGTVRGYLRQQRGYGRAEAMLERKWPEKYNALGHVSWGGRLYGIGAAPLSLRRSRVHYGVWGAGLFQRLYRPSEWTAAAIPLMPEWYLLIAALGIAALIVGTHGAAMLAAAIVAVPVATLLGVAAASASRGLRAGRSLGRWEKLKLAGTTTTLYLLQPLARLRGRLAQGLTPWRRMGEAPRSRRGPRSWTVWSEEWDAPESRLRQLEDGLRERGASVRRGGAYDRWDLEVRTGALGSARILTATEEHGSGHQLVRFRAWRRLSPLAFAVAVVGILLALAALAGPAPLALLPGAIVLLILSRGATQSVSAVALTARTAELLAEPAAPNPSEDLKRGGLLAALRPQSAEAER